jgi:hypothetical protein
MKPVNDQVFKAVDEDRQDELIKALADSKADLAAGRYFVRTPEQHVADLMTELHP